MIRAEQRARGSRAATRRDLWWLKPWWLLGMAIVPTIALAYTTSADDYQKYWRYPKFVTGQTVAWVLSLLVAIVVPAVLVALERRRAGEHRSWDLTRREVRVVRQCFLHLFVATVAGYGIWLALGAANGFSFGQLTGVGTTYDPSQAQDQFEGVSGITTMTQFGVAAAVVGALLWPYAKGYEKAMTIVVIAAAPVRALMVSERLAAVEVFIPVAILVIGRAYASRRAMPTRRLLIRLAPLLAVPGLVVGFTMYESTRSWKWYRDNSNQTNLWSFGTHRLIGYYSTAYGNAELLRDGAWPRSGALPYITISALWTAPVLGDLVSYQELTGESFNHRSYQAQIAVSNREFNNNGGITSFTLDYGPAGGLVAAGLFGALVGAAYAAFADGRRWGLLVYPVFVTGLLELSRVFYLGGGRAAPSLLGVVYVAARLRRARHQDRRWGTDPVPRSWRNLGATVAPGVPRGVDDETAPVPAASGLTSSSRSTTRMNVSR